MSALEKRRNWNMQETLILSSANEQLRSQKTEDLPWPRATGFIHKSWESETEVASTCTTGTEKLTQEKHSMYKIYNIHAPEVEFISKGKANKRYEFEVKVGMASTSKGYWIVCIQVIHGNPYDGHTLDHTLEQVVRMTKREPQDEYVYLGYRGHNYHWDTQINIVNNRKMKKLTLSVKKRIKRRSAIEPIFGHLKSTNRMSKNFLKGEVGNRINDLPCGCGYNMRKHLAVFLFHISELLGFIKNHKSEKKLSSQMNYVFI